MTNARNSSLLALKLAALTLFLFTSRVHTLRADALLTENFDYPNGVITNEYAFWNPTDKKAIRSSVWEMTSGSFFAKDGVGWTGIPDTHAVDVRSVVGTNSAVFRLTTQRSDFKDVSVSFSVKNQGLSSTPSTPAVDWDGLHVWLRYQSEELLYYASVNRRDNKVVIKKKKPGGPSNGGTYYELSPYVPSPVHFNAWQNFTAKIKTNADNSVTISLYGGDTLLVSATDTGKIGGSAITAPGKVGFRGDNANLLLDNVVVSDVDEKPAPPAPPAVKALPAPSGVAVARGDKKVIVRWDAVTGAASYNLYYGNAVGVTKRSGARLADVKSPATLEVLDGGTRFVVLTAATATDESAESVEVSAKPLDAGAAPAPVPHTERGRVHPAVWVVDKSRGTPITFDHLAVDSTVNIFSRSTPVASLSAADGSARWDLKNDADQPVSSGVYGYVLKDETGKTQRGSIVIVK